MRKTNRRQLLRAATAALTVLAGLCTGPAIAGDYPERPITMLVGYKAGGQTDLVGRAAAKVLSDQLGVPVNVVNKPGGGGILAAHELSKAKPDGYTLLFHANSVINTVPFLMKRVTFKPEDFEYAGMITSYQVGLAAQKNAPYDTLEEFVAWARENPGFSFGSLSPTARMTMEVIARKEGLDVNIVPLKGGGDLLNALLGNQVDLVWSGGIHYKYPDQLKTIVALTTFRHPSAPDVETIDEAGYPLGMDGFTTLILPKGTPREMLERLSTALKAAETDATFAKVVAAANIPIMYKDLDEAAAEVAESYARNKTIFESAGIEPQ
ncbi:Bug family tripartite tricarboxylate transporter substrate binding protein [Pseudodonghicola xiamenensis]|uniref:Tripartite-type tricarboxylate transporter, receptor component TctC n=1 Tax=Pseudodonghicola xiamenensis TaxID=337702 RepID=A0A8J3MD07_9RHOB|nr:tripartite tricarboxylate transporter substrate binding protein [Pseudodonghicola xiamenensis]GHG95586.1 hypothetical protein GCM10010961_29330 [Pseudodonghicola xiamenensis]